MQEHWVGGFRLLIDSPLINVKLYVFFILPVTAVLGEKEKQEGSRVRKGDRNKSIWKPIQGIIRLKTAFEYLYGNLLFFPDVKLIWKTLQENPLFVYQHNILHRSETNTQNKTEIGGKKCTPTELLKIISR
jgi:hypothetical protein